MKAIWHLLITKDFVQQVCIALEDSAYFGDGDSIDSNPDGTRAPATNHRNHWPYTSMS